MRGRLLRVFKAFTYRDYSLLWAGAFTSSIGTWMQQTAQAWLVFTMTGSAFFLSLDSFLATAPFLLFSLVGGVLADRVDRRKMLLLSQWIQLTSAFLLAGLILAGAIHVWMILSLSFVVGVAQSFGGPAYQALVPTLVDPEDVPNAVTLNSIQFNLARVVGPILAGVAFYALGAAACFGLNGLSFVAVIAALLSLRRGAFAAPPVRQSILASLRAGLAEVRDAHAMRGLVGLAFAGSFCAFPLLTFLPVFAKDVFHGDAKDYSNLLAFFGVGGVLGAVGVAGVIGRVKRKGAAAVAMQMTFGGLMTAFALSRSPVLSSGILVLAGACLLIVFAMFMTLVQTKVADAMRGRVVSVYTLAFRGAMALGPLFAGVVATLLPVPWVLVGNGTLLMLLGATVFLRGSREGVTSL